MSRVSPADISFILQDVLYTFKAAVAGMRHCIAKQGCDMHADACQQLVCVRGWSLLWAGSNTPKGC